MLWHICESFRKTEKKVDERLIFILVLFPPSKNKKKANKQKKQKTIQIQKDFHKSNGSKDYSETYFNYFKQWKMP